MRKKKLIGIFATDISSRVQGNLYTEIHKKAVEYGYNLVLFSGTYDKLTLKNTSGTSKDLFEQAQYIDFEAFIIHAQSIGNMDMINMIISMGKAKNIPIFVYDGEAIGVAKTEGVIAIDPDYKQGFADCVRHIIEHHKCKNIYMLAGVRDNKYSDDRIAMYKQELEAHGMVYSSEKVMYGDFWEEPTMIAITRMLDTITELPDAICCANDSMAIATIKTLKGRGIRVPEDILVTGFDGIEDGKCITPSISTCEPMLEFVSEFIFDVISKKKECDEFPIPLKFYPKESCGCTTNSRDEDKAERTKLVDNVRTSSWLHNMLSNIQFELLDRDNIKAIFDSMNGILNLFSTYSQLFCLRDNIEFLSDYTEKQQKLKIYLNRGFLTDEVQSQDGDNANGDGGLILTDRVLSAIYNSEPEDIYMFRMIHHTDNRYGCHILKNQHYSSIELNLLAQFTETVTIVLEGIIRNIKLNQATQKLNEMYEKMSEIYVRDTMTGLYNRQGYYQNFDDYIRRNDISQGYVQLISIDMDGMKFINDNYGHAEGDNAIKAVAKAIDDCFAQPCVCGRFGGDEFCVALFTEKGEGPSADKISSKLNNYIASLPMMADKEYKVLVSVGQVTAKLSEIDDFKIIEKLADDNMYIEKRKHKAKVK